MATEAGYVVVVSGRTPDNATHIYDRFNEPDAGPFTEDEANEAAGNIHTDTAIHGMSAFVASLEAMDRPPEPQLRQPDAEAEAPDDADHQ